MGFVDREVNIRLLDQYGGDVQQVVNHLLSKQ